MRFAWTALFALSCAAAQPWERIDSHVHAGPPPDAFFAMLERLNVRVLNVTLVDPLAPGFDRTEPQTTWAIDIAKRSRGRVAWASTFDPSGLERADFADQTKRHLRETFERGAVAVKMYKSVGLYLKRANGRYVLPDDPAFAPVLEMIAASGKTLLAHVGEPRSSWLPLDPQDPHYSYYKANPDWHMFRHPERPSWEAILAARDRMLAEHPKLRVVGCHLGSMEFDVAEIAKRLDRFPNFAVDTTARVANLQRQPREKVRAFLMRYQDRVLWGTDLMELKWDDPGAAMKRWESAYAREWNYFAKELALPDAVLRKVFRENALRWIPGLNEPLPPAEQIVAKYVSALGGEDALRKVKTWGARGSLESPTFGTWGQYEEVAAAPNQWLRTFRVPNYGVTQRCFNSGAAWAEDPEYGVESIGGARLEELRREAEFYLPLNFAKFYQTFTVTGRTDSAFEMTAERPNGIHEKFWFDAKTGLLSEVEWVETARSGVKQTVRMTYEDYRVVDGVKVAHVLRFESPGLIWIVRRGVAHNVPVDGKVFEKR